MEIINVKNLSDRNILEIVIEDVLSKCRKQHGGCNNCKLECVWRIADNNTTINNNHIDSIEHTCEFCYYEDFDLFAYPCSMCVKGYERIDKFQPK